VPELQAAVPSSSQHPVQKKINKKSGLNFAVSVYEVLSRSGLKRHPVTNLYQISGFYQIEGFIV